jgi:hypothetical protein
MQRWGTPQADGLAGFYCYAEPDGVEPTTVPAPLRGAFWLPLARLYATVHCFLRHGANAMEDCAEDGRMAALMCPGCGRVFWRERPHHPVARRELLLGLGASELEPPNRFVERCFGFCAPPVIIPRNRW